MHACVCMKIINLRTCCIDANLDWTRLVIDAFREKSECLHQLDKTHYLLKECEELL